MKYIDFQDKKIKNRFIIITLFLIVIYYWVPLFVMDVAVDVAFYEDYVLTNKQIVLEIISSFIMIILMIIVIYFFKKLNLNFLKSDTIRKKNKIISNITTFIMAISSLPLIFTWIISDGLGRSELYQFIGPIRQNVLISIMFSVALVSSLVELYYGKKRNILILFFIGVLPELLFGTRVTMFRFIFLLLVIFKWNVKIILSAVSTLLLIGMSRVFTGYSNSSLHDYVVLFLGDPINIYLGTSKILQMDDFSCGIDGLHPLKAFIFPIKIRSFFDDYVGDTAICLSSFNIRGLGNTLANELVIAPFSVVSSLFLLIIVMFFLKQKRINPLINLYFILILISVFPYIMRNGFIATTNHIVTILIWGLIPLFLLLNMKNKKKDKEQS